MFKSLTSAIVAGALGVVSAVPVDGQPLCRPTLRISDVQFSEMVPPTLQRQWTATVSVDAAQCEPNSSGYFDVAFTRLSETAPDLDFRQRYAWRPLSVAVVVNFSANEAVERYRIENTTSCVCVK
jgi:hypothetical protein